MNWNGLELPEAYYQDDEVYIIHGDCREILPLIPDKSIDLVLTDPPYGVRKIEEWDNRDYFKSNIQLWLNQCRKLSDSVIWLASDQMLTFILDGRDDLQRVLFWNKPAGSQYAGASHNNIWYSSEIILVFGDKEYIISKGKKSNYIYSCINSRTIPFSDYGHPTTKPVYLIDELLLRYSDNGDLILDPFLGSGTTAYCAKKLNRKCIGIEIGEKYCEIAAKRCSQQVFNLKV